MGAGVTTVVLPLAGKTALVTGAGGGAGRAIALRLARDGAAIAVHYCGNRVGADETVHRIQMSGGRAVAIQANIARQDQVRALFREFDRRFDALDIVVNSAAISTEHHLSELIEDEIEWLVKVNLCGPLYIIAEATGRLKAGGRIINLAAGLERGYGNTGLNLAARLALQGYTQSWSDEFGRRGVTVNTLIPQGAAAHVDDRHLAERIHAIDASMFLDEKSRDIAAVVAFLVSPAASAVAGAHINMVAGVRRASRTRHSPAHSSVVRLEASFDEA